MLSAFGKGDTYGYHEESGYLLRVLKPYGGNATAGFISESSLSDESSLYLLIIASCVFTSFSLPFL